MFGAASNARSSRMKINSGYRLVHIENCTIFVRCRNINQKLNLHIAHRCQHAAQSWLAVCPAKVHIALPDLSGGVFAPQNPGPVVIAAGPRFICHYGAFPSLWFGHSAQSAMPAIDSRCQPALPPVQANTSFCQRQTYRQDQHIMHCILVAGWNGSFGKGSIFQK